MIMCTFNKLANRYDAWFDSEKGKPLYESEVLCLRPLVAELSAPLLEIGVGTGRFATRFPGAIGLDPAVGALRMASKRGVPSILGVGEKLPFKDENFGGVLIILTLCFVKNPIEVLRESWRVLYQSVSLILGIIPEYSHWGAFSAILIKKQRDSYVYRPYRDDW
jgi:ubiquinone/menaquinone biosynthesis C-methylase UbiE